MIRKPRRPKLKPTVKQLHKCPAPPHLCRSRRIRILTRFPILIGYLTMVAMTYGFMIASVGSTAAFQALLDYLKVILPL